MRYITLIVASHHYSAETRSASPTTECSSISNAQSKFRKRQQEARRREQASKGLPSMPKITTMPGTDRWQATIEAAELLLSQAADEMNGYYADRSETWKESYAAEEHRQREKAITKIAKALDEMVMLW